MRKLSVIAMTMLAAFSCSNRSNDKTAIVSATYTIDSVQEGIIKVTLLVKNNDTINYFIPFIRPAYHYSKLTDKRNSKEVDSDPYLDFLLKKHIRRNELIRACQIDSAIFDQSKDSMIYYFNEPFTKKHYDSLLTSFKDKEELHFIYSYFFYAIGNNCLYLKTGEEKEIIFYISINPMPIKSIAINFDFNTDSIPLYKEIYFRYIPVKIEGYNIFKGRIKIE